MTDTITLEICPNGGFTARAHADFGIVHNAGFSDLPIALAELLELAFEAAGKRDAKRTPDAEPVVVPDDDIGGEVFEVAGEELDTQSAPEPEDTETSDEDETLFSSDEELVTGRTVTGEWR